MQLYFIRHAQSENNLLWDTYGAGNRRSEDPDLTTTGMQQIQLLAEFLSRNGLKRNNIPRKDYHNRFGFNFTHLYASPMIRDAMTGYAVSSRINISLKLWIDLHESGGIYLKNEEGELVGLSGKSDNYFLEKFPGIVMDPLITSEGWWNRPYEPSDIRTERA